jgi:hypothetical protein
MEDQTRHAAAVDDLARLVLHSASDSGDPVMRMKDS